MTAMIIDALLALLAELAGVTVLLGILSFYWKTMTKKTK